MRGLCSLRSTLNMDTKMFAKKTRIYGIAMQTAGFAVCGSSLTRAAQCYGVGPAREEPRTTEAVVRATCLMIELRKVGSSKPALRQPPQHLVMAFTRSNGA